MKNTSISWAHHTFNPWEGCEKISPACKNCYAEERDGRFHRGRHWGPDAPRLIRTREEYWRQPLAWNRAAAAAGEQHRVFANSLSDFFERRADLVDPRIRTIDLIEETPHLNWLLTTKRPENIRVMVPGSWITNPRPNVWYITTVETMEYVDRIAFLRGVPAAVRGLSVEPVLGDMSHLHRHLDGIDWVIVGGESGDQARKTPIEWIRGVVDQVDLWNDAEHWRSDNDWPVALWVKQLGSRPTGLVNIETKGKRDKHEDIERFPQWARRRELPTPRYQEVAAA